MTNQTWFIDLDLHLSDPPGDELIDALIDAIEPLYGAIAAGPGNKLGLSLAVECQDSWEAFERAHKFAERELAMLLPDAAVSSLRVLDEATRKEENDAPRFPELMSVPDIADLLGVTRQMARKHTMKAGFPAPALTPRTGSLWTRAAVESWNERTERHTGRPKATPPQAW